jgi:hypothetical protein
MFGVDVPLQALSAQGVKVSTIGAPYFNAPTSPTEYTIFRSSLVVGYGMLGIGAHF